MHSGQRRRPDPSRPGVPLSLRRGAEALRDLLWRAAAHGAIHGHGEGPAPLRPAAGHRHIAQGGRVRARSVARPAAARAAGTHQSGPGGTAAVPVGGLWRDASRAVWWHCQVPVRPPGLGIPGLRGDCDTGWGGGGGGCMDIRRVARCSVRGRGSGKGRGRSARVEQEEQSGSTGDATFGTSAS